MYLSIDEKKVFIPQGIVPEHSTLRRKAGYQVRMTFEVDGNMALCLSIWEKAERNSTGQMFNALKVWERKKETLQDRCITIIKKLTACK